MNSPFLLILKSLSPLFLLYVIWQFTLAAFRILSSSYIFDSFTIICCDHNLFWSCLFEIVRASCTQMSIFFPHSEMFKTIISSNRLSMSFSFSLPSPSLNICLMVSHGSSETSFILFLLSFSFYMSDRDISKDLPSSSNILSFP